MTKSVKLICFNLSFAFIYCIFKNFEKYTFINCSFIISMFYLLFGSLCFVWEQGFFDIPIYSFNKISKQLQKKRGVLVDEPIVTLQFYKESKKSFIYTNPLFLVGSVISLVNLALSFIVYYF